MNFKLFLIGLLMTTLLGCKPSLVEPTADNKSCNFPKRVGFVNDYCHLLNADEMQKLEQTIADFNAKTGTQIIVVIEDSKKSHSRKFHCPQGIAQEWQLGAPEKFDDFMIVISNKRKFIDFTYGLKHNRKLTPEQHNHLLYEIILPAFKKKNYFDGLRLGIDYFISHQTDSSVSTTMP